MNRLRIALVTLGTLGVMAGGGAAIANAAGSSSTNSGTTTTTPGSTTTPSQSSTHPSLPEHVGRTALDHIDSSPATEEAPVQAGAASSAARSRKRQRSFSPCS